MCVCVLCVWVLYVAVAVATNTCNLGGIFVERHLPVMGHVCIPVLLVTLLIVINSHVVYILIWLFDVHLKYVTIEGHICYCYIYGNSMVIKMCIF